MFKKDNLYMYNKQIYFVPAPPCCDGKIPVPGAQVLMGWIAIPIFLGATIMCRIVFDVPWLCKEGNVCPLFCI